MKILLIAMSGIGDTLIATPLIHELRANFPDARIDVLVMYPGAKDLLEGNPSVNRIWQKNIIKLGPFATLSFLNQLRKERYDISINAHTQGRRAYRFIAGFIGARQRVGHCYENTASWEKLLIHKTVPEDYSVHSIENNNRLLPLVGARSVLRAHEMEVTLTNEETSWAQHFIAANQLATRPKLGIHVGSGGTKNLALKRWPLECWLEFLKKLTTQRPEIGVIMLGGPEEKEPHAHIRREIPSPSLFTPETRSLRQAGALIKRCDGFLSVDTALMHLAAAVRVPNQIVIEAPTLNPTNVPYGNKFSVVPNPAIGGRNLEYYRYNGKPIRGTDDELTALMSSVKPPVVLEAITRRLPKI